MKLFTAAYLIFAPSLSFGAVDLCAGLFKGVEKTIGVEDSQRISGPLEIKKTERLSELSELLRTEVIESGQVDTTKLRSEFKHYMEASKSEQLIRDLAEKFPPKFSADGKLISGLASRDGTVKLNTDQLRALPILQETRFGKTVYDTIKEQGLLTALKTPIVFAQNRELVRSRLSQIVGHVRVDNLLKQIDELHVRAVIAASAKGPETYTDTSSTAKFSYHTKLSREAILESANKFKINLDDNQVAALEKLELGNASEDDAFTLARSLQKLGIKRSRAEDFVAELRDQSLDEGVVRYRKYRIGKENIPFTNIPAPGHEQTTTNDSIKDGWFADKVTWLEFKMKNTQGEASRATVVNKPRFPLPDDIMPLIKDPARFVSRQEFANTKKLIKDAVQKTVDDLKRKGVREVNFSEVELDTAIDFLRSLHLQNFSLEPVGRTVYMRQSYNLNLPSETGKPHNIQVTRDRYVWELSRKTGTMVQALPYVAKEQDWHFQYNSQTGMYEHLSKNLKRVKHVFHPRAPEHVYEVDGDQRTAVDVHVDPVEVVEIKVPLQFVNFSEENLKTVPQLAAIAELRSEMIKATNDLNERRAVYGLDPFELDKGKRSSSRKDIAGGFKALVHPKFKDETVKRKKLKKVDFDFNPESGYWVAWDEGAQLIYHPSFGVLKFNSPNPFKIHDLTEQSLKLQPVYYQTLKK